MKNFIRTDYRYFFCFLIFLVSNSTSFATHTLGGYITYESDSVTNNYRRVFFKLTLYTDNSSSATHSTAILNFSDGAQLTANRAGGGEVNTQVGRSIYYFDHTFAGSGTFSVSNVEPARRHNILNIPNSSGKSFTLSSSVSVNPFIGQLGSPRPMAPPVFDIKYNTTAAKLTYNMAFYDPNGDSLSYKLVPALYNPYPPVSTTANIPEYIKPAFASINKVTSALSIENTGQQGLYTLAIKISKHRNKVVIGSVIVDFMFNYRLGFSGLNPIFSITNRQSIPINSHDQISISTNQELRVAVQFADAQADEVQLTSKSELLLKNKATFTQSGTAKIINGEFLFTPDITLKRNSPYLLIFTGTARKGDEVIRQDFTIPVYVEPKGPLGLKNYAFLDNLLAYPNPAEDFIIISQKTFRRGSKLLVYNYVGSLMWEKELKSKEVKLSRNEVIKAGNYFYIISDAEEVVQSGRFIFK